MQALRFELRKDERIDWVADPRLGGAVGGSATGGTWSGGTGTYAPNNTTLNAVYTPSAAEYAAGSVTLTLTTNDPTGPCTFASSNVTFTFFPTPVVIFTVDDPDGCPVHCVQFSDLSTVGAGNTIVSWSWNFGEAGSGANNVSTTQNPTHNYVTTFVSSLRYLCTRPNINFYSP